MININVWLWCAEEPETVYRISRQSSLVVALKVSGCTLDIVYRQEGYTSACVVWDSKCCFKSLILHNTCTCDTAAGSSKFADSVESKTWREINRMTLILLNSALFHEPQLLKPTTLLSLWRCTPFVQICIFQVTAEVFLHPAQGDLYFGEKPLISSSTRRIHLCISAESNTNWGINFFWSLFFFCSVGYIQ